MKRIHTNTQKLVFYLIMVLLIPVIILIIAYNVYTFRSLTNEFMAVGEEHARKLQTELDEKTSLIDSYLINESTSNDFSMICYNSGDIFNRNLSLTNIISRFSQKIQDIPEIAALFILSDEFCRERYNSYIGYPASSILKDYARNTLKDAPLSASWNYCQVDGTDYFVYIFSKENVKMICFFCIDRLYQECFSGMYEDHICILTDSEERVIFQFPKRLAIETLAGVREDSHAYLKTSEGRYLYLSRPSAHLAYTVHSATRFNNLLNNVSVLQGLIMILSLLLLLTIPLYFFLINRLYLRPLKRLTLDILDMQHNNRMERLNADYGIQEFTLFQESLNGLLSKIDHLTKKYYEKEMETQKVQLQFFRLQLKPHFYLNCLKKIYSLLNQQKYNDANEALFYLANYLRFILKDDAFLIPLSDEMECIGNYLYLYNIGAAQPITAKTDIDSSLRSCRIPMLLLETFIENSIKYAMPSDTRLRLSIEGRLLDDCQHQKVYFCIRDNGAGFDEEFIQTYNAGPVSHEEGTPNGIGIINIMQRCHLLYHGDEFFHFSNHHGAMIEIMIPYNQ